MIAVSVIISNYNYADYLPAAIESALNQTIRDMEVIVVDDGSTDASQEIIRRYGSSVRAIFKPNAGQASALNAGFAASHGQTVIFLDADDVLLPTAAQRAAESLRATGVSKVHWPLAVIDEAGTPNGRRHPNTPLPAGAFRDELIARGPWMCETPPTSGNAWARWLLESLIPIPEKPFAICADAYLLAGAALLGELRRIEEPQSCYRLHGQNNYWNRPFEDQLLASMAAYDEQCRAASHLMEKLKIRHDSSNWKQFSWWHRVNRAVQSIENAVPNGAAFGLADDDQWGTPVCLRGRRRLAFPHVSSSYNGPPADDGQAVSALDELRSHGADFFALGWPSDWYLNHYPRFAERLLNHSRQVSANDAIRIFALK